jgi:23S rRNA (uridine2552-2'-O)-methyltransferase
MPKPYQPNDKWSQRAAAEGYRARSVYKLQELNERYDILDSGMIVLDLGAAPGSWMQYTSKIVEPNGMVIGMDLTPIAPIAENVFTYEQDITDFAAIEKILATHNVQHVDVVLSDIAPNTSGVKDVDQWRSVELSRAVMAVAERFLRRGGRIVMKVFRGADFDPFLNEVRLQYGNVKVKQVDASRDRSREVYVVGTKLILLT